MTREHAEKLIGVVALVLSIELVFFKFLPDVSTAIIQHGKSALADYSAFDQAYMTPGTVHYARFLGNHILYCLARFLDPLYHSDDPRLHPLRVAAGILTPAYCYLGAHLALSDGARMAWRHFMPAYAFAMLISLYVFDPSDMPSVAFLSLALFCLLQERMLPCLLLTLAAGLFRESSLHAVALVGVWTVCDLSSPVRKRVGWLAAFALTFLLEYVVVRHFFPGPMSSAAGLILSPRALFLEGGFLSLTTICSLGLAALFPIACLLRMRDIPQADWRRSFFVLNSYGFPAWIVFYRMMNGNLAEFRMLLPVLLPCIYGVAYAAIWRMPQLHRRAQ